MSVEFYTGSPGKFDSRTLSRKTLNRWTGRKRSKGAARRPVRGRPSHAAGLPDDIAIQSLIINDVIT